MAKQVTPDKPVEVPQPEKQPEITPPADPREPAVPVEDPNRVPSEDPFHPQPNEIPRPDQGFR